MNLYPAIDLRHGRCVRLFQGDFDQETGVVICPRHGANFDIRSGRALTLPAYEPVDVYPVRVVDGIVKVEL